MRNETTLETDPHEQKLAQHLYFPSAVYTITRRDFLHSVKPVFDESVAKAELKNAANSVHHAVISDNFFGDPRIAEFAQYIATTAWSILEGQGYNMQGKGTFFTEMRGQHHGKNSSVAEHVHPFVQIVGFYFLETPPESSKILIHDPRPAKVMVNMPEKDLSKTSMASSIIGFTPKPGMFFFANSWLPHSFSQHGSDEPLSFVHFNLGAQTTSFTAAPVTSNAEVI